jgi:hypothetical protein
MFRPFGGLQDHEAPLHYSEAARKEAWLVLCRSGGFATVACPRFIALRIIGAAFAGG